MRQHFGSWAIAILIMVHLSVGTLRIEATDFRVSRRNPAAPDYLDAIRGVSRDSHGNVYVLDALRREIRAFDHRGHLLFSYSRIGRGVGELAIPWSLRADEQGHLFVLDIGSERVSEFSANRDSLHFIRSVSIGMKATDLCVMDSRLFLFGYFNNRLIHELTWEGKHVRSFGDPFGPNDNFAQQLLSRGNLACDAQASRMIVTADRLADIRAYSLTGGLVWGRKLNAFHEVQVRVLGAGRVGLTPPSEGVDIVTGVMFLTADRIAVQLERQAKRDGQVSASIVRNTKILSVDSGAELASQFSIPRLVGVNRGFGFTLSSRQDFYDISGVRLSFLSIGEK